MLKSKINWRIKIPFKILKKLKSKIQQLDKQVIRHNGDSWRISSTSTPSSLVVRKMENHPKHKWRVRKPVSTKLKPRLRLINLRNWQWKLKKINKQKRKLQQMPRQQLLKKSKRKMRKKLKPKKTRKLRLKQLMPPKRTMELLLNPKKMKRRMMIRQKNKRNKITAKFYKKKIQLKVKKN